MKTELKRYDAVIFDLGGVILNIDYHKTIEAFQKLGLKDFDKMYSQASQAGLFDLLETGKISAQSFINQLLPYLPLGTSPNHVVEAWNAMLLDFPKENLQFLEELKKQMPIYLLSNTNEIHISAFHRKLKNEFGKSHLEVYFEKAYFSNEIQMRKPTIEIFEFVCTENKLNISNTLFIDDSIQHIEGASKFGLQTFHYSFKEKLTKIFSR
jgi:glucose-1-phosphatase